MDRRHQTARVLSFLARAHLLEVSVLASKEDAVAQGEAETVYEREGEHREDGESQILAETLNAALRPRAR